MRHTLRVTLRMKTMRVCTHQSFSFFQKRKRIPRFAGFAGLYSPKGGKKGPNASQGRREAGRAAFSHQNIFSEQCSTNPRNPQTRKAHQDEKRHTMLRRGVQAGTWVTNREGVMPRISAVVIETDSSSPTGYALSWDGYRESFGTPESIERFRPVRSFRFVSVHGDFV